ncbi:hypothetical protein [Methanocella paludicola]|uniref:hypothetical protein n=1 Tax=Methanocella paludicola TaxID=570267 RepID=UPI0010084389|nr:hypothetical protein [Methanocella paludicola]
MAIAPALGQSLLDMTLPSSFIINGTKARDSANNVVDIWGPVEIFKVGNNAYVSVPTNSPAGARLAFFQDTSTGALFRNNTLMLAINGTSGPAASMALMTGDLTSDGTRFYGQVTDVELDTVALADGDAAAGAVLYLNVWPDRPTYHISISNNGTIKKAVSDEATKSGQTGKVKLMLDVNGESISYIIVRMKAPYAGDNVSAYRYGDGGVTRLACKAIRSNESVIYETISSGDGTFAFVGPFQEAPAPGPGTTDVLIFMGAVAALQLGLVRAAIAVIRKTSQG